MTGRRTALALSLVPLLAGACAGRADTDRARTTAPVATASVAPIASLPDAGATKDDAHAKLLIARMLKRVAAARGLAPKRDVPGVVLGRRDLIAKIKEHVEREVPPQAITNEQVALQLLGFIPAKFDYLKETLLLLEAQLAGFYEPSDRTMFLAGDLDDENATATLAHELVHALQDQYYDLATLSKYVPGQSDHQSAISALAEGDATSAMADVLIASQDKSALDISDDMFATQVLASVSTGPAASEPHVMRTSLVSPYIEGIRFVNTLRRSGGWSHVDDAWKTPPTTTEQILHVDKWEAHEPAIEVHVPEDGPPMVMNARWKAVDHDTQGELGLRLAYEEWIGGTRAAGIARGWGGDATTLFASGDAYAIAVHVRYDADAKRNAELAFNAIADALRVKFADTSAREKAIACFERAAQGPLAIAWRGADLAIVAGPARAGAEGMTAAASCADAKKWIASVIAAP